MDLNSKIALITGGTKGIGAATAITLATEGADVALVSRTADAKGVQTRDTIRKFGRRCEIILADCGHPAEVARCVREATAQLGPIEVLVHSAGGPVNAGLFDLTPRQCDDAVYVHVPPVL